MNNNQQKKVHAKNLATCGITTVLFFLVVTQGIFEVKTQEEYVYYGVVPNNIWRIWPNDTVYGNFSLGWKTDKSTWNITDLATLMFLGYQDGTTIQVRHLKNGTLIYETTLGEMQKDLCYIRNGTQFKITSNHPLYVLFMSGYHDFNNLTGPAPQCFHLSVTGSYSGKQFMLIASDDLFRDEYRIIALEAATVTITDEDGNEETFTLKANEFRTPYFINAKAYRIESTGNIMITSGAAGQGAQSSYLVPCVEGVSKGTAFYTRTSDGWNRDEENGFYVIAYEDTKITIWDLYSKTILNETNVQAGNFIRLKPETTNTQAMMAIMTNKPVTVMFMHEGSLRSTHVRDGQMWEYIPYGRGLVYMGVMPNEEMAFYLPVESNVQAYIFANEVTNIQLDGTPITIQRDDYTLLQLQGLHTISSDRNLIIQIIHWPLQPPNQAIHSWAVVIPSIQTVNTATEVSLTSLESGLPTTYIIVGAAVAILVVAIVVIMMRRRA